MVKTTQTRCLIFSLYFMRPTPHTKSTIWKAQTIADWPWHRWSDWRSVARYGAAPSLRQQWLHGWEAGCHREVEWSSSASHRKYGWWCSGQCCSDNGVIANAESPLLASWEHGGKCHPTRFSFSVSNQVVWFQYNLAVHVILNLWIGKKNLIRTRSKRLDYKDYIGLTIKMILILINKCSLARALVTFQPSLLKTLRR